MSAVDRVIESAQEDLNTAADSESVDRTVYYTSRANSLLLMAILKEIEYLRADLRKNSATQL